jgi:hypothetical protein
VQIFKIGDLFKKSHVRSRTLLPRASGSKNNGAGKQVIFSLSDAKPY